MKYRRQVLVVFGWLVLSLAISASGCKKPGGTIPIHGRVSYRGAPLPKATVMFYPTTGRPVPVSAPNGEYSAELMPGDYTVTVDVGVELPAGFKEGDAIPTPKVLLADEYTSRVKSTLKATVKAGEADPIDFDLK